MATKIKFQAKTRDTVTVNSVSFALNGPNKGIIYDWRQRIAPFVLGQIKRQAPVNNVNNTMSEYRKGGKGVTGKYREGLQWQRVGNQYALGIKFLATAEHSKYVEYGRGSSGKTQYFSSAKAYSFNQGSYSKVIPIGEPFWHDSTKRRAGSRTTYGWGRFLEKSSTYWMREVVANTPIDFKPG